MYVGSVCTHPSYNDKNPHSVFLIPVLKSSFSNQAVLRLLSEWRSSVQAPPTIVDWQDRLTLAPPPWVNCVHCVDSGAGKTRCLWLSDWGVLMLDFKMNIAVLIYSRHLSSRLMYFRFEDNAPIPDLPKCIYVCESYVIQLHLQKKLVLGFLWIFANRLS